VREKNKNKEKKLRVVVGEGVGSVSRVSVKRVELQKEVLDGGVGDHPWVVECVIHTYSSCWVCIQ